MRNTPLIKTLAIAGVTALAVGMTTVPSQAKSEALGGAPERFEEPIAFAFPDFDNGYVVFVNTSRESVCTDQQVQYEEDALAWDTDHLDDFFEWIDSGKDPAEFEPQPPEPVPFSDGDQLVSVKQITTGKGAIVDQVRGRDLGIEIWQLDEGAPGTGPCLDTASETVVGTGTVGIRSNDNDLDASGTRANAFGNALSAQVVSEEGDAFSYISRFHVSDRCYVPEAGPPACLIERNVVR